MKINESGTDRIARAVVGIVLLVLFLANVVSGTLGIILAVVGAVLLLTGIVGFCPIYYALRIGTKK